MSSTDYPGQHKFWSARNPNQLGGTLTNQLPNYASMIAALELRVAALEKRLGGDEIAELQRRLDNALKALNAGVS